MTVVRTKRKIAASIAAVAAAALGLQGLIVRNAILFLQSKDGGGCACAAGGVSWSQWFLVGLAGLAIVGLLSGVIFMVRTLWRTRKLVAAVGLTARRGEVVRFEGGRCEAFTFGLWKPRVAICGHCLDTLAAAELNAMIAHEQYHVRHHDPLKFLLLDSLKWALFYVPLLRTLASWYRMTAEIAADEQVANRDALGGALVRLVAPARGTAVASFASALSVRIERLVNPDWRLQLRIGLGHLLTMGVLLIGVGWVAVRGSTSTARPACAIRNSSSCLMPTVDWNPTASYTGMYY